MRGSVFGQAGRNEEALADFNKAISLDPNYGQAYGNRGLIYRKTGKLDLALADYNKAIDARSELRGGLSRPRHRLPAAQAGARRLQGLQQGDRDPPRQRRGLLQPRPALSEPEAASVRDRRFLDRDRADAEPGRALYRARPELHGGQRLQGRGGRSRRRGVGRAAEPAGLDHAAPSPTSGWATRRRRPAPTPARSTSTRTTSRPSRASPASAARWARPIRRFDRVPRSAAEPIPQRRGRRPSRAATTPRARAAAASRHRCPWQSRTPPGSRAAPAG